MLFDDIGVLFHQSKRLCLGINQLGETHQALEGNRQVHFILDFEVRTVMALVFATIDEISALTAVFGDLADQPGAVFGTGGTVETSHELDTESAFSLKELFLNPPFLLI